MPSIADLFVSVTSDVSGAISGLTSVDQKVNGTSAAMTAAAPAGYALAGAATAVGAAFLSSVTTAADFEHQINGIKAVMSPTEVQEFGGAVEDLAIKLGKDTVFSSSQAAAAIETMIKAGVPLPAILSGAAASALDLASATGTDVTLAAELASTAMNTFHVSADGLGGIMDTISNVSNATATSVQQLKFGLAAVGPVANGLGISFGDTATALGIFANNGLQGSDAGTSLKTMLLNLEPSTKAQKAAFDALGITTNGTANQFFDASGTAKDMRDIFEILKTSTAGLTDEQKINLLQTAFGTDAVRAATIAANEGATGWDAVTAAMDKMGGTQVAAEQRNKGLAGSLNQLGGSFEAIQITVGTLFLPVLTQLVNMLTGLLNGFLTLDPGIQTAIVAVVGIAGAAAGLLAGFILLGPVLGALGAAFGIIAGAIATVALPIAALVAAGALLYAAWQDDFGGIREVTEQVWDAIQPAFVNIQNFISAIRDTLAPMFAQAQTAAGPFIEQMSQALAPILAQLPGLVRSLGDELNKLGGLLQQARGAFDQIGPVVEMVAQAINFLITGNLDRLVELMQEGVPQPFVAALQFIRDVITVQIQVWGDLLGGIKDFIGYLAAGDVQGAFNSLIATFGKIKDDILPLWNEFLTVLGGLIGEIGPFIADRAVDLWQALLDELGRLPGQLQPYWDNFAGWLGGVLAGLPQFIGDAAGDVWAFMRTVFENLPSVLQPAWDAFAGWLGAVLGGLPQFVGDMAGDVWAALRAAFEGLADMLSPAWDNFAAWLGAVVGGIAQFVFDNMGDIFGPLAGAFFGLVDLLAPAWDAFAGWLGNVLAGLPQFVADHIGDVWGALIAAFTGSTPGTTTTPGGVTPAPAPAPVGGGGITGPLISIGVLNVGTVAEQDAFLQQMSDAILAAAQRLTTPPPASSPFLP